MRKGAKPDYVTRALEDSLRRLHTDRVDLYQLHAPDPDTPIADTLGALGECIAAGKVHEIGCSNFTVEQLQEAEAAATGGGARFVSVQNEFSLLRRRAERDVIPECERAGLSFLPYFPLASGVLTGKYRRGQAPPAGARLAGVKQNEGPLSDTQLAVVERLTEWAADRNRTMVELAIAWILRPPSGGLGHRRGHLARAGARQRGRRRLGARRRRDGRDRRALGTLEVAQRPGVATMRPRRTASTRRA